MHYHEPPRQGTVDDIIPESKWLHHNGGRYWVICISNMAATNPEFVKTVTYQCVNGIIWSRPLIEFLEKFKFVGK